MLRHLGLLAWGAMLGATAAHADCAADFEAAMKAHQQAGPYHTETQLTMGDQTRTLFTDVILPDKFRITQTSPKTEALLTAAGAWVLNNDEWQVMPDKRRDEILAGSEYSLRGAFKAAKSIQCKGPQPIEGKSLTAFAFDMINAAQNNTPIQAMVYLDEAGAPVITTNDYQLGARKVHMILHVKHDPAITIEPPVIPQAVSTADPACLAEMKSMGDAMTAAGPLRYAITDHSGGKTMSVTAELIPSQAMRMSWDGGEQIITGTGGWMKDNGTWKGLPAEALAEAQYEFMSPWWAVPEKLKNLRCLGEQSFEGAKHVAYAFDLERFLGAKSLQHATLFKGSDGLPVALNVSKDGEANGTGMVAHLSFDKNIKIEAPK